MSEEILRYLSQVRILKRGTGSVHVIDVTTGFPFPLFERLSAAQKTRVRNEIIEGKNYYAVLNETPANVTALSFHDTLEEAEQKAGQNLGKKVKLTKEKLALIFKGEKHKFTEEEDEQEWQG